MSRKSDIEALRELRDDITEAQTLIGITEKEVARCDECDEELTNTKFVFQPLPTNQAQIAKNGFFEKWVDKYSHPNKPRAVLLWIFTVLIALFAIWIFVDMAGAFGMLFSDIEAVHSLNSVLTKRMTWIFYVAEIVFALMVVLIVWGILEKDMREGLWRFIIVGAVSGFLFYGLCEILKNPSVFWVFIAIIAAPLIGGGLITLIYSIKRKHPRLNAKQEAVVAAEQQKDDENAVKNVEKEKADRAAWESWWAERKRVVEEQLGIHMNVASSAITKAKELRAKIDENDTIGDNEKDVETIDWLIYILEGHRADSIKEALQQYDLMQHNERMLEIEREKYNLEVARVQQERADRQRALEMEHYHQMQMQAQAARAAAAQESLAYNSAAIRDSAEKLRREVAWNASASVDLQRQIAGDISFQRMQNYYNN